MQEEHFLIPHMKINSVWINDLTLRPETIKIPEENTGDDLSDISCSDTFLDKSPEARETKQK